MIVLKNVRVPDGAWAFEITFRTVEDKEQITIGGIIKDQIEDVASELEKANKTIEELMKINEELGAYNGQFDAARKRIQELEDDVRYYKNRLSEMIEESQAEKNLIKSAVKEAIKEMINGEIK